MGRKKRAERLQIMLTREEVAALEAWRFENKMPSRSAAARALMNLGLEQSVSDRARHALLHGDVASGDVSVVQEDAGGQPVLEEDRERRILIVDPDSLAARGISWIVREAGFRPLEPAASIAQAESHLTDGTSPIAVITEVAFGEESVERLGERLLQLHIPFIFCTSSSVRSSLPERWWDVPVISKASAPTALSKALAALIQEDDTTAGQ